MKLPSILKIVCALACITAAGAGHASNSSILSFTNFSYTLIDLDPNDGITPSITFASSYPSHALVRDWKDYRSTNNWGAAGLASVSATLADAAFSGSATVSGNGTFSTLGLTASSVISNAKPSGADTSSMASFGASAFQLSANTGIRFNFTSAGTLHRDTVSGDWDLYSVYAFGGVEFNIDGQRRQSRNWQADASLADPSKPYDYSWSESVVISYDNLGSRSASGTILGSVNTGGMISNIPEPSSYAMLGAGLAMLGAVRARRRQQR